MVLTKVGILIFFIVVGAFYVKPANWHPFAPSGGLASDRERR
jgi:APA family basic amino acid/polyamine antiporter